MKVELIVLKGKDTLGFHIIGFNSNKDYGEVFVTINNSKTSIFRGTGSREVIRKARKETERNLF
ncbi:hypothetical protein [Rossellomorea aquimaris]|uniref:hypothetical protein n=1 Tax=Rossellomorea aquimaris TaxID=189382 RepID=UPI001CFE1F24|nr:hypothetical protein [Rossellomorea aquimaris]